MSEQRTRPARALAAIAVLTAAFSTAQAQLSLGAAEYVVAGGSNIGVTGYSVPSFVEWNEDGLPDLLVGEGSGSYIGRVRVYLNAGTSFQPQFPGYSYVQSNGADLELLGGG